MEQRNVSPVKNTLLFIAFIAVVVGFLFSISGDRSNRIPDNEYHINLTDVEYCLSCHGPDGSNPRGPEHPPKDDCILCHKTKRDRKFR
jgi:cytochrome c553